MALTDKQKKIIIASAGVIALGALIYAALPKSDSSGTDYDTTGNGSPATTNNTNFNAAAVAQELYLQMKDTLQNTVIFKGHVDLMAILTKLTTTQFQQVITAFGSKPYNTMFGNQLSTLWGELDKHPLKVWLENELWDDEYEQLALRFKNLNYL